MSRSRAEKRMGNPVYWQSSDLNYRQYMHYYYMFQEIMVNRVKWHGLPRSVDERFLQMTLYRYGVSVFFRPWFTDKFLCTQVTPSGKWNVYDNPTRFTAWGNNGFSYRAGMDKGVIIWAHRSRITDANTVDIYARRLADIDRTIDVNLKAMKTPTLITCPEAKLASLREAYKQYDGNEPVMFGVDGMLEDVQFKVFKTDAPYLADKMLLDKQKIINEFYTFAGIDNANQDKKERQITDEVQANNGQIETMRLSVLDPLRDACAEINHRYRDRLGDEITVSWNHDIFTNNYVYNHDQMVFNDVDKTEGGF